MQVLCYFMAVLFLISAILQYNDPDPAMWMLIYLVATVFSVLTPHRKMSSFLYLGVIAICLVWIAIISPDMWGHIGFGEMFEEMKATKPLVEIGREVGGLLIIAIWMGVAGWYNRKKYGV